MKLLRLFPRDQKFFELMLKSAQNCERGAQLLVALAQKLDKLEQRAEAIKEVERQGDALTQEIIQKLDRTFITPIDREDLHRLATAIDDVLDLIDSVADRAALYELQTTTKAMKQLAGLLHRSCQEITQGVAGLERGDRQAINGHCRRVDEMEREADSIVRRAIAKLFKSEPDPIEVLKWKEVYDFLEEAIDCCEDGADLLESTAIKHS